MTTDGIIWASVAGAMYIGGFIPTAAFCWGCFVLGGGREKDLGYIFAPLIWPVFWPWMILRKDR